MIYISVDILLKEFSEVMKTIRHLVIVLRLISITIICSLADYSQNSEYHGYLSDGQNNDDDIDIRHRIEMSDGFSVVDDTEVVDDSEDDDDNEDDADNEDDDDHYGIPKRRSIVDVGGFLSSRFVRSDPLSRQARQLPASSSDSIVEGELEQLVSRTTRKPNAKKLSSKPSKKNLSQNGTNRRWRVSNRKVKGKNNRKMIGLSNLEYPACPSTVHWIQPTTGINLNRQEVEIVQPFGSWNQSFYSISCIERNETATCPTCCHGVDHRRFNSKCKQQYTFMPAVVRRENSTVNEWSYVRVNASCSCAVSRKSQ